MESLGRHIVVDVINCDKDILNDANFLKETIELSAIKANATVLNIESRTFQPQGVTVYCLLEESHISIHTWPEHGVALIDAFTCGSKCKPEDAIEYIMDKIKGISENYIYLKRGIGHNELGEEKI
ncbi:adenosylmethionine decarboxylase [bacterium]|jgi:S-adenosylmethionine decarboxylase|nr:adenosylmethionine decarboxylase [bacterium]